MTDPPLTTTTGTVDDDSAPLSQWDFGYPQQEGIVISRILSAIVAPGLWLPQVESRSEQKTEIGQVPVLNSFRKNMPTGREPMYW